MTEINAARTSLEDVEEALKDVIDPELGVNVVDLGLLYGLKYSEEDGALLIDMTLTTAACPLTDVLEEQVGQSLDGIVDDWRLNWVWMPPWGPERITDDGKDQMRALGFNIYDPPPPAGHPCAKGGPPVVLLVVTCLPKALKGLKFDDAFSGQTSALGR
jgi:metal-sulfur cluster biosynthetic enzyme